MNLCSPSCRASCCMPRRLTRVFVLGISTALSVALGAGATVVPTADVIQISIRPIGAATQLTESPELTARPPLRRTQSLIGTAIGQGPPTSATSMEPLKSSPSSATAKPPSSATSRRNTPTLRSAPAAPTLQPGQLKARRPAPVPMTPKADIPSKQGLVALDGYRFGLGKKEQDLGAKGPSSEPVELAEAMRVDVDLRRQDLLDVFPLVYRDQNPDSGVYYYLPGRYRLAWQADEGYGLRFLYTATAGTSGGDVLVALRLDARVDLQEVEIARRLLQAYIKRHGLGQLRQLRPLPISGPPEVSLAGNLEHQYDIPATKVSVSALSDSLAEIEIGFSVDSVTKENLQLALEENVGLAGRVTLTPYGDELSGQEVSLDVRLADASTFGRFAWQRDAPWHNPTPYPIALRYLHIMTLDGEVPMVYSWQLEGEDVPPGAIAEMATDSIPSTLDSKAVRAWLDYRVVSDCEPCTRAIIETVSGGVSSIAAREITFRVLSPLADLGAEEMVLRVRSRYFHPQSRDWLEKPQIILSRDHQSLTVGSIYVDPAGDLDPAGESGTPFFEYKLDVVMPDGSFHSGSPWIPSSELYQPIGRVQAERAMAPPAEGGDP